MGIDLDIPPRIHPPQLRDTEPLAGRSGLIAAVNRMASNVELGGVDRAELRGGLRDGVSAERPGITPAELGAVLADHIRHGAPRVQSTAIQCAVRLYAVCAEEVQALRTLIGADSGGGDTHNHLHLQTQDPEVARVLAVAVRDPEVMAALDRAVARQGGGG